MFIILNRGGQMKLVMKADDGKEIVYLSSDDYSLATVEKLEDTLFVDVSKIEQKYKNYLYNFIQDGTGINFNMKEKGSEQILETPDIYFIFDDKLSNMIKEELKHNSIVNIVIGYSVEVKDEKLWNYFLAGVVENAS